MIKSKRHRVNKFKGARKFNHDSHHVHGKNIGPGLMRGGTRL